MQKMIKDYNYITGLIRSLQCKLLSESNIERMISSASPQDAYNVLADTDFAECVSDMPKVADLSKMLELSLLSTKDRLIKIVSSNKYSFDFCPEILDHSFSWYDCYNVKVIIKAKLKNLKFNDISDQLSPLGKISYLDLQKMIYDGKVLKYKINKVITKALDVDSFRKIDDIIDEHLLNDMIIWSRYLNSNTLSSYTKSTIDSFNAFKALRSENIKSSDKIIYFNHGSKHRSYFNNMNSSKRSFILNNMLDYEDDVIKSFSHLKKSFVNKLWKNLSSSRYMPHGKEIVFAYWWMREQSARTVHIIISSKQNNVSNSEISSLIPDIYY